MSRTSKPYDRMTADELADATAEFERENVDQTFAPATEQQVARLERAKRKRGRPKVGQGAVVVSVSLERGLLQRTDRLAKRLGVGRTRLISRGLQAILDKEVPLDPVDR